MTRISFKRHRFPAEVIRHVVWLYFRFTLNFRDAGALFGSRRINASYEPVRCWTTEFGPQIAAKLNRRIACVWPGKSSQTRPAP